MIYVYSIGQLLIIRNCNDSFEVGYLLQSAKSVSFTFNKYLIAYCKVGKILFMPIEYCHGPGFIFDEESTVIGDFRDDTEGLGFLLFIKSKDFLNAHGGFA